MPVKNLMGMVTPYSFCKHRAICFRYILYVILLILYPATLWGGTNTSVTASAPLVVARSSAGREVSVLGTQLGDTASAVLAAHPQAQLQEWRNGKGALLGQRFVTRQGYADGGFFQVLLTRKELGGVVWSVTRNTRTHAGERGVDTLLYNAGGNAAPVAAEPVLDRYIAGYGPYELLCTERFAEHVVYHVYWLHAPDDCSVPGGRPEKPYLYLNLVTGKWTEELLMLVDPVLGKANGELAHE